MVNRVNRLVRLAAALPLLALFSLVGCQTTCNVQVNSTPAGARILIDGGDSGQQTPATVVLATQTTKH